MTKKKKKIAKKDSQEVSYYVSGMHCASCEILIKNELGNINGITKVDVLASESVVCFQTATNSVPTLDELNGVLTPYGYSLSIEKSEPRKRALSEYFFILLILICAVFFYYVLKFSPLFKYLTLGPSSAIPTYFLFGLLAGVSSCGALVGSVLLTMSTQWGGQSSKKAILPFLYFNASRLVVFFVLGGVLGLLGSVFKISIFLSAVITVIVAILMLLLGAQLLGLMFVKNKVKSPFSGIATKYIDSHASLKGKYMPIIVGGLTFFFPCGFTLIAQTNVLSSGSYIFGALSMFAFAFGTLPILLLISFTSFKLHKNQAFSKKLNIVIGVIVILFALHTINSQLFILGIPSVSSLTRQSEKKLVPPVQVDPASGIQVMQMEASEFDYYPQQTTIKSGIKTRWDIYNHGVYGCAQAMYAPGLYPEVIYLKPGMNTIEFTPVKPGVYKVSCSMGMVAPITVTVL